MPRFPGSSPEEARERRTYRGTPLLLSFFSSFILFFSPSRSFFLSLSLSDSLSLCHARSLSILPARGSRSNRIRGSVSVAHAGRNVPMGRGTTDGVKKSVKRIRDAPNLHYRFYPEYARAPLASLSLCIFISVNPEDPSFFSFFFSTSLSLSLLVSLDQKPQVWKMKRLLLRPIPALFLSLIENRSISSPKSRYLVYSLLSMNRKLFRRTSYFLL